jgi:hypothetical protein
MSTLRTAIRSTIAAAAIGMAGLGLAGPAVAAPVPSPQDTHVVAENPAAPSDLTAAACAAAPAPDAHCPVADTGHKPARRR